MPNSPYKCPIGSCIQLMLFSLGFARYNVISIGRGASCALIRLCNLFSVKTSIPLGTISALVSLHFLTERVQKLNCLFLIISACALKYHADQNIFI